VKPCSKNYASAIFRRVFGQERALAPPMRPNKGKLVCPKRRGGLGSYAIHSRKRIAARLVSLRSTDG
jgi:hypothetical protein